jgi:hypothetical protein
MGKISNPYHHLALRVLPRDAVTALATGLSAGAGTVSCGLVEHVELTVPRQPRT